MIYEKKEYYQKKIETEKELINSIKKSEYLFYKNDQYLAENVGERSSVFKIGNYLSNEIAKTNLKEFNVDNEYNKNYLVPKRFFLKGNRIIPDLIIHKRGNNDNNLLIIEFKRGNNNSKQAIEYDVNKIREFMKENKNPKFNYNYTYGAFIIIGKKKFEISWFYKNNKKEIKQKDIK